VTPYAQTLSLIAAQRRRKPVRSTLVLDALFRSLSACVSEAHAQDIEDRIWQLWMYHPHRIARDALDRSASDIAARRYDVAETRLTRLLRSAPDYAEAWNKRATLYYLLGRDDHCVRDLGRTLKHEPRHFGALCSFGEILLAQGDAEAASYVFSAALALHPVLPRARAVLAGHRP